MRIQIHKKAPRATKRSESTARTPESSDWSSERVESSVRVFGAERAEYGIPDIFIPTEGRSPVNDAENQVSDNHG